MAGPSFLYYLICSTYVLAFALTFLQHSYYTQLTCIQTFARSFNYYNKYYIV